MSEVRSNSCSMSELAWKQETEISVAGGLLNTSRHFGTDPVSVSALAIMHSLTPCGRSKDRTASIGTNPPNILQIALDEY
jgi:hypothetical protein